MKTPSASKNNRRRIALAHRGCLVIGREGLVEEYDGIH